MRLLRFAPFVLLVAFTASPVAPMGAAAQSTDLAARVPAAVFIIRHAEKPLGDEKLPDLTAIGFQRANLLPTLFIAQPGSSKPPRFPRPTALFATDTSKHSDRPIETVTPLARALHLRVDHDYADREVSALATELLSGKYAGQVVLVCWHHGEIPHLAQALGVTDAPKKWDDTVFDRIWMVQWVGGKPQFDVLLENLLPGDATR
jgi:hypothetical protein